MHYSSAEMDAVAEKAIALPLLDKVKLLEILAATIQNDLAAQQKTPHRLLFGIWQGQTTTEQDIDESRQEMWGNFPREEF